MKNKTAKIKYAFLGLCKIFKHIPIINTQSNALFSKYKLYNIQYHKLRRGFKRYIIIANVKCPQKITLLLVHLALFRNTRKHQIKELEEIVNSIKGPIIALGDFNTFKGKKEVIELLENTKLTDKSKNKPTFPTANPKVRVDYILTSPEIKIKKYKVLKYPFSDHLPILVRFST